MGWPPQAGELLPRAEEAFGIRYKLTTYSLNINHPVGGPKARGLASILGISLASALHLEAEIRRGILQTPIAAIRENPPYGTNCVVDFSIQGIGVRSEISARMRTVWQAKQGAPPRLLSAYLKPLD
jgi:hypothetical protein